MYIHSEEKAWAAKYPNVHILFFSEPEISFFMLFVLKWHVLLLKPEKGGKVFKTAALLVNEILSSRLLLRKEPPQDPPSYPGGWVGFCRDCSNPRGGRRQPTWCSAQPGVEARGRSRALLLSKSEIWATLGARSPGPAPGHRGRRPARCKMPCHWETLQPEH